jgi:hypothetical protein
MTKKVRHPQTFVDRVLALLEDRFPWLDKEKDEQVSGADTVDELTKLHQNLTGMRDEGRRSSKRSDR